MRDKHLLDLVHELGLSRYVCRPYRERMRDAYYSDSPFYSEAHYRGWIFEFPVDCGDTFWFVGRLCQLLERK